MDPGGGPDRYMMYGSPQVTAENGVCYMEMVDTEVLHLVAHENCWGRFKSVQIPRQHLSQLSPRVCVGSRRMYL
jgi:hypothetical protein